MISSKARYLRSTVVSNLDDDGKRLSPLTLAEKKDSIISLYNDLVELVQFLFLPELGCLHVRAEWEMSSKSSGHPSNEL